MARAPQQAVDLRIFEAAAHARAPGTSTGGPAWPGEMARSW